MKQYLIHTPKTEEQILGIFPAGVYKAVIKQIDVMQSKTNPEKSYFVAIVDVNCPINGKKEIKTWLTLDYLLKHMYDACEKSDLYNQKELCNEDCEGHVILVKLDVKEPDQNYNRPKNYISDFLKLEEKTEAFDDEISF